MPYLRTKGETMTTNNTIVENKKERSAALDPEIDLDLLSALEHLLEDAIAFGMVESAYSGAIIEARNAIAKEKI